MAESSGGFADRFDYRVDIRPHRNQVTARVGERVIARTTRALLVDEQDHGLVFYFPEADVDLSALEAIEHVTVCPFKGEAAHWALAGGEQPVAWTYRQPHHEVARLAGHLAFYQDRVSVEVGVANPAVSGR
ncbi:MAG TPA: DUF427 domain-containing protein [Mycobacteriales bacterium]|nr:DUF427 domain-containing protein [Mycobacteriales bacterium]